MTSPQISVEEYERTHVLFERHEYVEGRLIPRPAATWNHARLQGWIGVLFYRHYSHLCIGASLHCKLRPANWRVVDIAIQELAIARQETYGLTPLLLAIEIRSPEDKWSEIFERFEDYHAWGVPYCWLIDPETERAWTYHKSEDFEEATNKGQIQAGEVQLSLEEVLSRLHEN